MTTTTPSGAADTVCVAYVIGSARVGGTERHLLELLRRIDRRRFSPLVVFVEAKGELRQDIESEGIPCLELGFRRSYTLGGIRRLMAVGRELKVRRVRVLHAYQFHGSLYASLLAVFAGQPKLLVSERGKHYRGWHRRLARRFYYRRAAKILVNTDALREYVRECGPLDHKILTIPNGVEVGRLRPRGEREAIRRRLGLPDSALVIGSVGRLQRVKGHHDLVEAFLKIAPVAPETRLLLVGDGPEQGRLRARIEEAGLSRRVVFAGFQPRVAPFLEAMDLFVLPSLSEAHSMALLEAVASGRTIVATDVGGNGETIEPGVTGVLVPPGAPDVLSETLLALRRDPERATALGRQAAESAPRFDLSEMVRRLEGIYAEIIAG